MSADDVNVNLINTTAPGGQVTPTGTFMAAGEVKRGPIGVPIRLLSLADYTARCLDRVTYGFLYDAAEAFFKNAAGFGQMLVSRAVGPSAVVATFTLLDASNASSLTVKAGYLGLTDPGDWANGAAGGLTVQVTHPTTGFALVIAYGGVTVETSPEFFGLTGIGDAIAWANTNSTHVQLSDPGAVAIPKVLAATNLASGADDRASIVTAQWTAALAAFTDDYGVGQVAIPGVTTTAVQQALIDHCEAHDRVALVDFADSASAATVAAAPSSLTGTSKRRAVPSAPWRLLAPLAGSAQNRSVPGSPSVAGIIARNDAATSLPGVYVAPSDDTGVDLAAIGLTQTYSAADRATLEAASINRAVVDGDSSVRLEGNDTLASETTDPQWDQITAVRTIMWVDWASKQLGARYRRKLNDPKRSLIGRFGKELTGEIIQPLADVGAISNDPTTAVDVGPSVNTDATIAAKRLLANETIQPTGTVGSVTINVLVEAL